MKKSYSNIETTVHPNFVKKSNTKSNPIQNCVGIMSRNIKYIVDQFLTIIKTTSPITKIFCALLIIGHLITYNATLYKILTLTPLFLPQLYYSFYALATHAFVEPRLIFCLLDILAVCLCGKLIEPLWGSLEMVKFFAIVSISTGFYTAIFYLAAYGFTFNVAYLFDTHIAGLFGYLAGISVAVKQIMPDHVLLSFRNSNCKIRNTHVPLLLFSLTLVLRFSGLLVDHEYIYNYNSSAISFSTLPKSDVFNNNSTPIIKYYPTPYPWMFMIGLFTSWIYLRFYQRHSNGTRGDGEENFSFASFFPSILQPPVRILSNLVFEILIRIKICKKPTVRRLNDTSYSSVTLNLPGFDSQDAERRRLKAIKALNERLTKSEIDPISWPTLDEGASAIALDQSSTLNPTSPQSSMNNLSSTSNQNNSTTRRDDPPSNDNTTAKTQSTLIEMDQN